MAVELCKVSLWIEALEPGRPLSFLDAHVKHGNALLGTTAELMDGGIPDDAYKLIEGDDPKTATAVRKQNKAERKGQLSLEDAVFRLTTGLAKQAAAIEATGDGTVAALHEKERAFRSFEDSDDYERARLAADAWCAAFVQCKQPGAPRITTGVVRRVASGEGEVAAALVAAVATLSEEFDFFHWQLEYPAVFAGADGGFSCVLGNPPWDQIQLDDREHFASSRPDIAAAPNMAARKRMIRDLATDDPDLYAAYAHAVRVVEGVQNFVHSSGCFPFTSYGRLNLASLFAERMRRLVAPLGRMGAIVPSGIATDSFNQYFFRDLVERQSLAGFFDFENRSAFPAVDSRFRFCLLTLTGSERPAREAEVVFLAHQVTDLVDPERRFTLAAEDFELLNPNTRTCPIFRNRRDAEITKAIYRRIPVLINESRGEEGNPWGFSGLLMFMMNTDSGLFRTRTELEPNGFTPDGNCFSNGDREYLPLYEAKMIHQFDDRWAIHDGLEIRDAAIKDKQNPTFVSTPRYWVSRSDVDGRLDKRWSRDWLLGWRDVTNVTNERTFISAIIPRTGVGNNFPLVIGSRTSAEVSSLLANFNAFVFDYVARQKMGGSHLNFFIVNQLPVIGPCRYGDACPWDGEASICTWLAPRVLELTYTSWGLELFANDLGYSGPPFRWDTDRRALLRSELDAAFFHLYGLDREDVDYVMETFPIIRRKDEQEYGEYRTKRLILEIFDDLSTAITTGAPYRTRLDPPPADRRAANVPSSVGPIGS
jgi:hypothetical protein